MIGGEIFIPKIPSMKVIDLAAYLAPHLPTRIIGIRPGEKLHESMSTEDDARNMLEFDDRYIIEPELMFWNRQHYSGNGARPVPENFRYASNTNEEWLSTANLERLLAKL
jgi:UDP-N-acetylglucosamine 4,6-dehydratase